MVLTRGEDAGRRCTTLITTAGEGIGVESRDDSRKEGKKSEVAKKEREERETHWSLRAGTRGEEENCDVGGWGRKRIGGASTFYMFFWIRGSGETELYDFTFCMNAVTPSKHSREFGY